MQSRNVLGAHEAELNSAVMGTQVGVTIRRSVAELLDVSPNEVTLKLGQDSQGTMCSIFA